MVSVGEGRAVVLNWFCKVGAYNTILNCKNCY